MIFSGKFDKVENKGEVPEWSNGLAWRASLRETVTGVRISPSPNKKQLNSMAKTYNLDNLEITWLKHASFKIKCLESKVYGPEFVIYIDPYNVSFAEKADLILVTHDHYDHKDEKSIAQLSKTTTEVLIGGKNIKEGEEKEVNGAKIKAVPAYNLVKPFHPKGRGVGFVIEIEGKKIYHAGDTDRIPEMAELGEIDLALLPIGGTYTMNEVEAAEAVKMFSPKKVIPMHYGTLSETPGNPEKFKELVGESSEVIIL